MTATATTTTAQHCIVEQVVVCKPKRTLHANRKYVCMYLCVFMFVCVYLCIMNINTIIITTFIITISSSSSSSTERQRMPPSERNERSCDPKCKRRP